MMLSMGGANVLTVENRDGGIPTEVPVAIGHSTFALVHLNYNRERSLREALKTVPGIRKLNRLIYRNLVAQYEITFGGKSDDLAEALATSAALKGYGFEIQGVSAGKIEAKAK